MTPVYAIAAHIVSPLGLDLGAHWQAVVSGTSGIRQHTDSSLAPAPFWGAVIDPSLWQIIHSEAKNKKALTPFEQLAVYSVRRALQDCEYPLNAAETAFILSTTKGNIELLGQVPDGQIQLSYSAQAIAGAAGITSKPIVISHACVSGVVALQYGLRLLQSGRYKNVIVTGCDRFSRFVLSGFQSFQAVADGPCKPFDAARKGINLGEAAATIILSTDDQNEPLTQLISGATSNDANHISGPSRTGEELGLAINRALEAANLQASDISMISAHGTATLYNDEMESKAFALAGMLQAPVHSMKGYVGHTLGAAGVLESTMIMESIRRQELIPSAGFEHIGVPEHINVTRAAAHADIRYVLKTASGFGGCNATAIWGRI
ncbi:beta-ketoacyl-[acyl-carrier-protein] synthase family protein [Chitinophagaceae bacterium MMS25-I14]